MNEMLGLMLGLRKDVRKVPGQNHCGNLLHHMQLHHCVDSRLKTGKYVHLQLDTHSAFISCLNVKEKLNGATVESLHYL